MLFDDTSFEIVQHQNSCSSSVKLILVHKTEIHVLFLCQIDFDVIESNVICVNDKDMYLDWFSHFGIHITFSFELFEKSEWKPTTIFYINALMFFVP